MEMVDFKTVPIECIYFMYDIFERGHQPLGMMTVRGASQATTDSATTS